MGTSANPSGPRCAAPWNTTASVGVANPEIGARLFISHRSVEWHLRKVFTKLGISSRKGLLGVADSGGSPLMSAPTEVM